MDIDTLLLTEVPILHQVSLFVLCRSLGFDKRMMPGIHHYGIIQMSATTLKIPCVLLSHLFLPPPSMCNF